ncbi:MAG: type II toxin-antitoxin system PemK/MazF family toxin [Rhodospirillales bacterium]|nr:type II toxin-antitoxin system PemK/MazF family toxin [Rhodospirillales bacterium]
MKRGDLVTVAGGGPYAGKPRPAVIVQSDNFPETESVTLSLLTGEQADLPLLRLRLEPDSTNNLAHVSWIMADKIITVRRRHVGHKFGRLRDEDILRLDRALMVFLGLAG